MVNVVTVGLRRVDDWNNQCPKRPYICPLMPNTILTLDWKPSAVLKGRNTSAITMKAGWPSGAETTVL